MMSEQTVVDDVEELDQIRITNLLGTLDHLRRYPEDDVLCVIDVQLPMSVLTQIMLCNARTRTSLNTIIVEALGRSGFPGSCS